MLLLVIGSCSIVVDRPIETGLVAVNAVFDTLVCGLGFCEPQPVADMIVRTVHEDTGVDPIVAIDVDARGRVFAAHSGRMDNGVLDNRDFTEAQLDEELSLRTVQDRRAMIDRGVKEGRYEKDEFTRATDVVAVYEDQDGDGTLETRSEVASVRAPEAGIGSGVLVRDADIYWTDIPDVWRLRDTDGDSIPDEQEVLSTGWGVRWAFYGHDMHGLVLGPDGKIYFSIGDRGFEVETPDGRTLRPDVDNGRGAVLRMNPDGSELEIFAQGLRNPQEIAFDDYGNLFTADNNSDSIDEARIVYVVEGGDSGWMMPYQLLRDPDYERGPWNAEKLWYQEHRGQPAYVIPPLRFIGRGPSGFAHAPGLGLPERYRNHFLAADYAYFRPMSGIRTFRVEADGAGFRATEPEWFLSNVLVTDMAFTLDGALYVVAYQHLPPRRGEIYRLEMDEATAAPQAERLREMAEIVRAGMADRSDDELAALLGFEDRRVRMPAQFELARRGAVTTLDRVARDTTAPLLGRLHALWGLGQLGAAGLRAADWESLEWLREEDDEVRAQAVRTVGTAGARWLAPVVVPFLQDDSARVRYFAALSLGKLRYVDAAPALADLLRENAGEDVFLRHAVSVALFEMNDAAALGALAEDPSAAVRMGALLAMRRLRRPEISRFLADPDPRLVVEAARAIHDLPIPDAEPALAALAGSRLPYADEDPQTSYALHRRVINANLREGSADAATRLAAHAADPSNPDYMRREALTALGHFTSPPSRDAVLGIWKPLPGRPREIVYTALDTHVPALLEGELEGQALDVAASYDRVPLGDDELYERIADEEADTRTRVASLRALNGRGGETEGREILGRAVARGLQSTDAGLRAEARDVLARRDLPAALVALDQVRDDAPLVERQRAIETLVAMEHPDADARLLAKMQQLASGELSADIGLDVLEAARSRSSAALRAAVARYDAGLDPEDSLAEHRVALAGGKAERGLVVFNGKGDCKRCHAIDGAGGETGPPLDGVAGRLTAEQLLEAIIEPNASIAAGYAQGTTGSAMPPIAVELPPRDLRDLMAYLQTLD